MATYTHDYVNGVKVELTAEQIKAYEDRDKAWEADKPNRDLKRIKELRIQYLKETDWWVSRGSMSDTQKNFRQKLRDIPADYSTSDYDSLLERDASTLKLKHAVWQKPSD
jgi:hypothetical protein